jgi:Xaa-Pro dipeptidase
MSDLFSSSDFFSHIDHLLSATREAMQANGIDVLALHSGSLHMQFLDDMPYPFKVNPQFKRWVPLLQHPECWVVIGLAGKPRLLYYQPVDFWHKVHPLPEEDWVVAFDVVTVAEAGEALKHIPDRPDTAVIAETGHGAKLPTKVQLNPAKLMAGLDYDRAIKTGYEIACMRRANRLGARAHLAAAEAYQAGGNEFAIQQAYCQAISVREQELPYNSIVALGSNASVLHYQVLDTQRREPAPSFLIDAGAAYRGYASDITRTYCREGGKFQELIDTMDNMQRRLVDRVRPGCQYIELHRQTHRDLAEVLRQCKLVTGDTDGLVEQGVTRAFFPHGLGHLIGLQVHDVGGFYADREGNRAPAPDDHPHLRLTRTLEPGFVITIEPGLYFIDSLLAELKEKPAGKQVNWQQVDGMRPYGGIRIEDDVVVTADAPENLTRDAFASL